MRARKRSALRSRAPSGARVRSRKVLNTLPLVGAVFGAVTGRAVADTWSTWYYDYTPANVSHWSNDANGDYRTGFNVQFYEWWQAGDTHGWTLDKNGNVAYHAVNTPQVGYAYLLHPDVYNGTNSCEWRKSNWDGLNHLMLCEHRLHK
jgi:hypothetical protein